MNYDRLVIVSNRLPIVISREEEKLQVSSGSGGLVTALAPVLKYRGGIWIGWPGSAEEGEQTQIRHLLDQEKISTGYELHPIFLNKDEIKLFYEGFSNQVIWPNFHDLLSECHFNPSFWTAYQEVNKKFAEGVKEKLKPNDFLWIHDYHLMLLGKYLRESEVNQKIGFFLHIPFPSLDIFTKIPWRFQILRALLAYDLIGFQTLRDLTNFMQCVRRLLPEVKIKSNRSVQTLKVGEKEIRAASFPISIDYDEVSKMAEGIEVTNLAWYDREKFKGQKVVFSCDRLDISKGIPQRLEAIRQLLKKYPEIHEKVTFFQVVIPSRDEIPGYQNLKKEIDRLVGEINSQYTQTGWTPIHYIYKSISRQELIAFYRIAEITLITPIKDGMNLVAKEYIASNVHENGVLVLSEFVGAADQLQHEALLINPFDVEGVAETIYLALTLPKKECKKRMKRMRRQVQRYDVFRWVQNFLETAISKELHDFPIIEQYTPKL